jgi:hypothetical protein
MIEVKNDTTHTNLYFTPDREDIRPGYECEYTTDSSVFRINATDCIQKGPLSFFDIKEIVDLGIEEDLASHIRVLYLTKEQIEAEGWKYIGKGAGPEWFEKTGQFDTDTWTAWRVVCHYGFDTRTIRIALDDMGEMHWIFEGKCKDINTLRYISKLLGI